MAGNVILGYDGSDGSKAALRVAVSVAMAYAAPLSIVFGYEPGQIAAEAKDYHDMLHQMGSDLVDDAVDGAHRAEPSLEVEKLVVPMRPVEALLEAAEEREARVIVVGQQAEAPRLWAILGSVPNKLVHRSKVPVLVVPVGES
jgi:nucleotide-binding universal stress UspA family protein